jgi:hypothetical protein
MPVMPNTSEHPRPELPEHGEISKTMVLRFLAPEIHALRAQGFKLEAIREILEAGHLQVSLPLMTKVLRVKPPASPSTECANG